MRHWRGYYSAQYLVVSINSCIQIFAPPTRQDSASFFGHERQYFGGICTRGVEMPYHTCGSQRQMVRISTVFQSSHFFAVQLAIQSNCLTSLLTRQSTQVEGSQPSDRAHFDIVSRKTIKSEACHGVQISSHCTSQHLKSQSTQPRPIR